MSYQLHYSVTYICNSCNGTYITGYVDAGLKRTKVIEGELFPLKSSVHQLGGSTQGDTALLRRTTENAYGGGPGQIRGSQTMLILM